MNVTTALILVGFVVGFFLNLCEITAEASILTLLPASGALAVNIVAGFFGLAINQLLNVVKIRFSTYSILFFAVVAMINLFVYSFIQPTPLWASVWFFMIILTGNSTLWLLDELVCRFINITDRTGFFPNLYLSFKGLVKSNSPQAQSRKRPIPARFAVSGRYSTQWFF